MRGVLLLLLVFAAFFPRARADDLPGKWLEVRSPNFVVVSDAGEHRARDAAVHFEQIRVLFTRFFPEGIRSSAPPLLVFAVSGEQTMKRFLPEAWQSRDRSRPKGAFRSVPTSSQVVLRADLVGGEDFQTVYHEYFHFLAQTGYQLQLPVWVDEGLAGFWGGTRLTPKETQVGLPNTTYLTVLKEGRLLPLPVLAHVDRSSSHYRQGHKASLFYAQSWALIHYILLGEESGEGAERLKDYVRRTARGMESQEALAEVFGDLDQLEQKLRKYVRRLLFPYSKLPPLPAPPTDHLQVREMAKAEAAALCARFILEGGQTTGAEPLVRQAREGAPELAATHEAAGLLHVLEKEYPEAARAFERAQALDAAGPLASYGLAVLGFYEDRGRESLAIVESRLQQILRLDPEFAPARARLAEVYRRTDATPERALASIREARRLRPDDLRDRLKEAQILLNGGDRDAANTLAEDAVLEAVGSEVASRNNTVCWYGSLWGLAEVVLPACDRAVELEPGKHSFLDSRGLARALAGQLPDALADFRTACEQAEGIWPESTRAKRRRWMESLERGVSPFLEDGLDDLREDPEEEGLGWSY